MVSVHMYSLRLCPAALVVLLLSSLWGCGKQSTDQGEAPKPTVQVATATPTSLPIALTYPARATGSREVEVRSRVTGILLERRYEEGKPIKKGQSMFSIDPAPFRAEAAQAKAELAMQRAQLERARRERDRIVPLLEKRAVSQAQRDEAVSALEVAEANVLAAEAKLKVAELNLEYTDVRAPISGLTSRETRSEGSLVTADSDSSLLTRIVQFDPLYIEFSLPDDEAGLVRKALRTPEIAKRVKVAILLADGTESERTAELNFVDNSVSANSGTVLARAVVKNGDMALLPGQFVRVRVDGLTLDDVIAVPRNAIASSAQGYFLWVLDNKDVVQPRPVTMGRSAGDTVVARGINAGERYVSEPSMSLRPGMAVTAAVESKPLQRARAEQAHGKDAA